jgi:hypothetical protein
VSTNKYRGMVLTGREKPHNPTANRFLVKERGPRGSEWVAYDPECMVRPCVAREFDEAAVSGLASMYPASSWSVVLRAIMDISAHAISLADRPQADH